MAPIMAATSAPCAFSDDPPFVFATDVVSVLLGLEEVELALLEVVLLELELDAAAEAFVVDAAAEEELAPAVGNVDEDGEPDVVTPVPVAPATVKPGEKL